MRLQRTRRRRKTKSHSSTLEFQRFRAMLIEYECKKTKLYISYISVLRLRFPCLPGREGTLGKELTWSRRGKQLRVREPRSASFVGAVRRISLHAAAASVNTSIYKREEYHRVVPRAPFKPETSPCNRFPIIARQLETANAILINPSKGQIYMYIHIYSRRGAIFSARMTEISRVYII